MLMCWNEEPRKRPTFSELRARFDAMLSAERSDEYIDLQHISSDKPYYRLDASATKAAAANNLHPSPRPSRHSFLLSQFGSRDCSPKPLPTPDFSPSHKSQTSRCSAEISPTRKPSGGDLTPSLNPVGGHSHHPNVHEQTSRRRGRDHTHEHRRPVSMLLPSDQERRERQNPYVDEPSRVAATTLAVPNGSGGHTRRGSDGAIELNHLGGSSARRPGQRTSTTRSQTVHVTITRDEKS